jgi:RHS repeat-associated protein
VAAGTLPEIHGPLAHHRQVGGELDADLRGPHHNVNVEGEANRGPPRHLHGVAHDAVLQTLGTILSNKSGAISYAYDDQGRLSALHHTVPASPNVSYPASLTYDAAGRVASVSSAFADSGSLVTYEYDAIGNVTRSVQDNIENLYAYDELCRLTTWTEKTGGQVTAEEKYYYDGNGNITEVGKIGETETHAYDAANQCTDTGFTHDVCGNLTSDGEWDYAYERGSRLASATNDTQNIKLVFGYDPRGRRYSKTAYERDGQGQYTVQKYAIYYHYDAGGNVLAETDAAGGLIRSYAYDLSGHPVAMTQDLGAGQKTFFLHSNARGDIICITDENMNWAKRFTYDPWGKVISETASSSAYEALACPYAYAGYFRDVETGLYYMPARYYSPFQRRFLTKDPHPGSKGSPITLNPYQYCGNNPINSVDPTGQYDFSFSLDCSGMNAYFNQMAADNAARSQAMSRILGGFVSAMSNFRASVQRSMANIGGLSANIQSAVSSIKSSFYQIALQNASNYIFGQIKNLIVILNSNHPTGPAPYSRSNWNIIDSVWDGVNYGLEVIGNLTKSAAIGYYFKALNSVSSGIRDLSHVIMGDITWGQFINLRLFDLGGYEPHIGFIVDILDAAYRTSL